jgi:hypothetical protein
MSLKLVIRKIIENFENMVEIVRKSENSGILETSISRKGMDKSCLDKCE